MSNSTPNVDRDLPVLLNQWRNNIPLYFREQLCLQHPISKPQKEIIDIIPQAIAERKPIYVGSGHAQGKDFLGGCIANWFLDCFVPSKVILTAPTDRQVKYIQWAETLSRFNQKKLKWGKPAGSPYIEIQKENWFLLGFTTKESVGTGGGKFQGIRSSENQCILVTEAQSVADTIYDQIDGVATAKNVLIIFWGNPTRVDGRFAKGLRDKKKNIVFNFSCLDSPNYLQRKIVIPGMASYEWVEDKRTRWGVTDPRWISRVEGKLPGTSLNQTFSPEIMDMMFARHGFLARFSFNRGVAVDSAGEGMDDNVFMSGSGGEIMEVHTTATIAPSVAAIKAVEMCKAINGTFIIVDCDGIGIGVWQELVALPEKYLQGIQIIKFHGSSQDVKTYEVGGQNKVEKKRMYENKRVEASFVAKERALRGQAACNEADTFLVAELEADEWFENKSGRVQLVDKEDIKEKLDPPRSPGRSDCFKMLQWAFEQKFEDKTYKPQEGAVQQYADTGQDVGQNEGQQYSQMD